VVPEIEMPGHSRAALAAYPEYSCTGELHPVPGLWGIFDDIYCSKSESIDFMKDILEEVLELFPSEYIHIGGDEAPKVRWHECDNCQKVIRDNGLKDEHELQSYFIRQIDAYLTEKGRKLIGWDEILEGGLSPNAAVMSWRGEAGGIEAAKQGHYVVMSPTTYCYFDYYQSAHDIEPLAIGGYLPLEKVYKYNPIPDEIPEEYKKYVLGGQANLWTEYMGSMDHVEYMAFPRALALIQSLWCTEKPEYDVFLESYLKHHEAYLELNEVNFAKSIHYPELKIERAENGIQIQFESLNPSEKYRVIRTSSTILNGSLASVFDASKLERHLIEVSDDDKVEVFELTSDGFEDTVNYIFNVTNDLGREIELVTPAHPKYDHNGSLNLVDGITGGDKFKGSEWLGFRETKIEMIVDVRNREVLNELRIGFKDNNGSWIYLPKYLILYTSDDKENWEKAGSAAKFIDGENTIPFSSINSNYIKIVIGSLDEIPAGNGGAGNTPWTFIDELEFIKAEK
jgi:hexosaminidase